MGKNKKRLRRLTTLRLEIDRLTQMATVIAQKGGDDVTEAGKSLKLAKAWLGHSMLELGSVSPYGSVPYEKEIPPTAEQYKETITVAENHLHSVNELREFIVKAIDFLDHTPEGDMTSGEHQARIKILEAKFFLGFELAKIRDNDRQSHSTQTYLT